MTIKRYRIEDSLGLAPASAGEAAPTAEMSAAQTARLDEILGAIQTLQRLTQASASETIDACRRELNEAFSMRGELDLMKEAITRTKQEIAALHRSENSGKGMRRAADELDAVVGSTERATTSLLTAIEDIETNANMLRASMGKAGQDNVDAILERVIVAYEACNFQDLTGQRISKIVGVLKFVEDHLDRVIEAWSGLDSFRDFASLQDAGPNIDDESSLLNGPKLEDDIGHVDQTDIDALFD
jgi:chemotaxis protein CheZ